MKNTRIWYQYKDKKHNNKTNSIVVAGKLSEDDISVIQRSLVDKHLFIPAQVGMPPLSGNAEHDHVWHEIDLSAAQGTMTQPSVDFTAGELVERFETVAWNPAAETARMFGVNPEMTYEGRVSRQGHRMPVRY